jgi:RNA polymerase sigma-70 factor (ECF subfamily)
MVLHIAGHTDQALLSLMAQGDKGAFDYLYERYAHMMFLSAYKRLKDQDQCKDIVQDIWTDLWLRRREVSIAQLKPYLLAAVRFQVFKLVERGQPTTNFFEPFQQMVLTGTGADGSVREKELAAMFRDWLECLPAKRKEIFILHYADKLSVQEIAEKLQISTKTVHNQLGNAVSDLRNRLVSMFFTLA